MNFFGVALTFAALVGAFVAGGASMLAYLKENYQVTYLILRYEHKCPRAIDVIRKAVQKEMEGEP